MRRLLLAAALALAGCPAGDLGHRCKPDGTCNAPGLTCQHVGDNGGGRVMECHPAPAPKSCHGDADCFCEACLKRCGAEGVKRCEFTDVTVWGSKPTVCECRS